MHKFFHTCIMPNSHNSLCVVWLVDWMCIALIKVGVTLESGLVLMSSVGRQWQKAECHEFLPI